MILEETFFSSSIIPLIPKSNNSPNSPQIRQIEKFWAIFKERALEGIKFQKVETKNQQNPDGAGAYSQPNPV